MLFICRPIHEFVSPDIRMRCQITIMGLLVLAFCSRNEKELYQQIFPSCPVSSTNVGNIRRATSNSPPSPNGENPCAADRSYAHIRSGLSSTSMIKDDAGSLANYLIGYYFIFSSDPSSANLPTPDRPFRPELQ